MTDDYTQDELVDRALTMLIAAAYGNPIVRRSVDQVEAEVRRLRLRPTADEVFEGITHGDALHREWLREACDNLWSGKPVPPPRGTNIPEASDD